MKDRCGQTWTIRGRFTFTVLSTSASRNGSLKHVSLILHNDDPTDLDTEGTVVDLWERGAPDWDDAGGGLERIA